MTLSDDDVVLARMARRWLLSRDTFGNRPMMMVDEYGGNFILLHGSVRTTAVNDVERELVWRIWERAGVLAEREAENVGRRR